MFESARGYSPGDAGVDLDLRLRLGPIEPVLSRLDSRLRDPIALNATEFADLVAFVRDGLLDERAKRKTSAGWSRVGAQRIAGPPVPGLPVAAIMVAQR